MQINNTEINQVLMDKLKDTDISLATEQCTKSALKFRIDMDILTRNNCNSCTSKGCESRVVPSGNVSSSIMIILDKPSELDGKVKIPMFDAAGRYLTVILDKLGHTRDNIYITTAMKCSNSNDLNSSALCCAASYLSREIALVKPKKIITFGTLSYNTIMSVYCDKEPIADVSAIRGSVQKIDFFGQEAEVLNLISIESLITKAGALYSSYKLEMWNSIKGFLDRN